MNKSVPLPVSYERLVGQPLDITDVFTSEDELQRYLVSGVCYAGQFVALLSKGVTIPYIIADNNGYKILLRLALKDDTQTSTGGGDTYMPLTFVDENINYFINDASYITYRTLDDWMNNGWKDLANCDFINTDTGKQYKGRWIIIVKVSQDVVGNLEYVAVTQPFSTSKQGYSLAEKKITMQDVKLTSGFLSLCATNCNILYALSSTSFEIQKSQDYGVTFQPLYLSQSAINCISTSADGKYVYFANGENKLFYSCDYGTSFVEKLNNVSISDIHVSQNGKIVYIVEGSSYMYSCDYGSTFKNISLPYSYSYPEPISAISKTGSSIVTASLSNTYTLNISFDQGRTIKSSQYAYTMGVENAPSGLPQPMIFPIFNDKGNTMFVFDEYNFSIRIINESNVPSQIVNARTVHGYYDKSKHLNEQYLTTFLLGYTSDTDRIYYAVMTSTNSGGYNTYLYAYDVINNAFISLYNFPGMELNGYATGVACKAGTMTLAYKDGVNDNNVPITSIMYIRQLNYVLDYIKDGVLYQLPLKGGNGLYITRKSENDIEYLEISIDPISIPSQPSDPVITDAPYQFIREGYLEKTVSETYPGKLVYVLSKKPYLDTISVFLNGVYIPPKNDDGSANYTTDMNYLILNSSILYYDSNVGDSYMTIDTDDQIDVTYFVAKSMSGDSGSTSGSGSVPTIDPVTKHWFIDGVDTGVCAEGRSNLLRMNKITDSAVVFGNDYEVYYLENPTSDVNFTLSLNNDVQTENKILSYEIHLRLESVKNVTFPEAIKWISDIPEKTLSAGYYYAFIFRTHDGGKTWTGNLAYKFPLNAVVKPGSTDTIILTFNCSEGALGGFVNILDSNNRIVQSIASPINGNKYIFDKQFNFATGGYVVDYSNLTAKPIGSYVYKPIDRIYSVLYYINGQSQTVGTDYSNDPANKRLTLASKSGSMTHDIDIKVIPAPVSPLDGTIMI